MKRAWSMWLWAVVAVLAPAVVRAASLDGLDAKSFEERQKALEELVKAGKGALPDLVKGASDGRPFVRMYCVKALGVLADPSTLEALNKVATSDANAAIRADAALALGALQTDAAATALLKIAGDGADVAGDADRYVRLCAAQGLCKFRTKHTIPILISLLKHADVDIPPVPAKALANLTTFDFGTNYAKWKEWWQANKDTFVVKETVFPYNPLEREEAVKEQPEKKEPEKKE
jgi:hypothetical protein